MEYTEIDNEKLIFTFEGENNIDINLLVNALNGIAETYRNVIYAKNHKANLELKIEAFNKGSFEVIINSVVSTIPTIAPVAPAVLSNIKTFLDIIKFKKDLKVKRLKEIVSEGDKSKVINANGEMHYHNCDVTNIYINNRQIDKGLTELFTSLKLNKSRKAVRFKSNDEQVIVTDQEYQDMSNNIIEKPEVIITKFIENEGTEELLLKKPDLLGESKWQFQYDGRIIDTVIQDKKFLQRVRKGEIKTLYAHVRVPVKMKIEIFMDDKLEVVNRKYTILGVIGDIIEPEPYEQLKFY